MTQEVTTMQVLDDYSQGSARGGACYLCNAGRRDVRDPDGTLRSERVVDLGINIDFEGHLQVCESCALEIGRLVGMVRGLDAERMVAEGRHLVAEAEGLRDAALCEASNARQEAAEANGAVDLILTRLQDVPDPPAPKKTATRKVAA